MVCAVGSEAAVHLGKAVALEGGMEELILVPVSYPAVLASNMEKSLVIDTQEETLVPTKATTESSSPSNKPIAG